MKKTKRDNWQVVAVVRPQKTHMSIASLGFKDTWGDPLEGLVWGQQFELTILPKRLGDVGMGLSMSDSLISRDIEGDYQKRCEVLRGGMLQHPNVIEARIESDGYDYCSHCDRQWEELWNNSEVSEFGQEDGLSVIGEPVCCTAAINEFRAERGIAPCST
jgi:hypothetical protein